MTLTAFLAAWFLHLIAAASPGPAILMAAKIGATDGFRTALALSIGIGLGALFWAVSALLGVAVLFKVMPAMFLGFKIAGGVFLLWIGLQMWRHADVPLAASDGPASRLTAGKALWLGLVTQLANPKPAVFFGAVFVGTLPAGATPPWIAALLVAIFMNEFFCNILVARMFSTAAIKHAYTRQKRWVDRVFGSIIGLLGAKIALT